MKVYLNGKFVDAARARLGVFDAAVQHAVGLFETMRAYNGRIFRLDAHIDRLITSAQQLGMTDRLKPGPLAEAAQATLEKNNLDEARLRLTITGGDLGPTAPTAGKKRKKQHDPGVIIAASEPTAYPDKFFSDGVTVTIADPKANPFDPIASHKTLNYWVRLQTLAEAAASQAAESLWFMVTNHLCGGAVSNAVLVKDGQLYTPFVRGEEAEGAIPSPALPGITRAAVIEQAEALDLPVHRKMLTINDVLEADELFLTNSSWQILPVVKVEKETIGDGAVGAITTQLRDKLFETIAAECSGE